MYTYTISLHFGLFQFTWFFSFSIFSFLIYTTDRCHSKLGYVSEMFLFWYGLRWFSKLFIESNRDFRWSWGIHAIFLWFSDWFLFKWKCVCIPRVRLKITSNHHKYIPLTYIALNNIFFKLIRFGRSVDTNTKPKPQINTNDKLHSLACLL